MAYLGQYIKFILAAGAAALILWQLYLRFGFRIHSRERLYSLSGSMPLIGRPDLVMQEWGGLLVCHDLKTRKADRVYESDVLQLSLYAFLLRCAIRRKVARHAYVRVSQNGLTRLHKVDLTWSDEDLLSLYNRFYQCKTLPSLAQMTAKPYYCKSCGFNGVECKGKAPISRR